MICGEQSLAGLSPLFKPSLEGGLAFPRGSARKQALDADVLVEVFPMDALSFADESPVGPFLGRGGDESWDVAWTSLGNQVSGTETLARREAPR